MSTVPFTVLPSLDGATVDVTLYGPRGSVTAVVPFTPAEARELQRQIGVAIFQLRPGATR